MLIIMLSGWLLNGFLVHESYVNPTIRLIFSTRALCKKIVSLPVFFGPSRETLCLLYNVPTPTLKLT